MAPGSSSHQRAPSWCVRKNPPALSLFSTPRRQTTPRRKARGPLARRCRSELRIQPFLQFVEAACLARPVACRARPSSSSSTPRGSRGSVRRGGSSSVAVRAVWHHRTGRWPLRSTTRFMRSTFERSTREPPAVGFSHAPSRRNCHRFWLIASAPHPHPRLGVREHAVPA